MREMNKIHSPLASPPYHFVPYVCKQDTSEVPLMSVKEIRWLVFRLYRLRFYNNWIWFFMPDFVCSYYIIIFSSEQRSAIAMHISKGGSVSPANFVIVE